MTTGQKFSQATSTIPIVMSAGDLLLTLRVRAAMSPNVWAYGRARGQTIGVAQEATPKVFARAGAVRASGRSRSELPMTVGTASTCESARRLCPVWALTGSAARPKAFPLLKVDRRCCGGDRCSEVVKGYQMPARH